jgi:hypothetical protein
VRLPEGTISWRLVAVSALLSIVAGCYASREAVTPPDALQPDVNDDAFHFDAPPIPNNGLGWDCSLGGDGQGSAYAIVGGGVADMGRFDPRSEGWQGSVRFEALDGRERPRIHLEYSLRGSLRVQTFAFSPPTEEMFAPGEYPNATHPRVRRWGAPALDVRARGVQCETLAGRFTVHEIVVTGGTLIRFRASFAFQCDGSGVETTGCVRHNAIRL